MHPLHCVAHFCQLGELVSQKSNLRSLSCENVVRCVEMVCDALASCVARQGRAGHGVARRGRAGQGRAGK